MRTYKDAHDKLLKELKNTEMYLKAVENVFELHGDEDEVDLSENYNKILFSARKAHKITVKRLKAEIEYLEENNAEYFI